MKWKKRLRENKKLTIGNKEKQFIIALQLKLQVIINPGAI